MMTALRKAIGLNWLRLRCHALRSLFRCCLLLLLHLLLCILPDIRRAWLRLEVQSMDRRWRWLRRSCWLLWQLTTTSLLS